MRRNSSGGTSPLADIFGMVLAVGGIIAFFSAAMSAQVGVAFVATRAGGHMLFPLISFGILGHLTLNQKVHPFLLSTVAICILVMVNLRGFYWGIFPRGHGFWTNNRLSGCALYALAYVSPYIYQRWLPRPSAKWR